MRTFVLLIGVFIIFLITSCQFSSEKEKWTDNVVEVALFQLKLAADEMKDSTGMPRSLWTEYDIDFLSSQLERHDSTFLSSLLRKPSIEELGRRHNCSIYDWTSGFFPGSLWYLYGSCR